MKDLQPETPVKYKKLPLVTIMIPTYNQESFIADAIKSALRQDYPNLEIIVADDSSSDGTEAVARQYASDPRIRYIRNEKNLGRVGNYHHCAHQLARGEWVINLDGDDYFTSTSFISDAIGQLIKNQNREIVAYCYRHDIDRIATEIPSQRMSGNVILCSGKDYFLNYYKFGGFAHHSILWRREPALKTGMYLVPWQASDFHALMRLFLCGDMILDNRQVAYWRVHNNNTTTLEADDKWTQTCLTFNALEEFALPLFAPEEIKVWRKGMDAAAYKDYITTRVYTHRDSKSFRLLLSNPSFGRAYFRNWFRLIFGR